MENLRGIILNCLFNFFVCSSLLSSFVVAQEVERSPLVRKSVSWPEDEKVLKSVKKYRLKAKERKAKCEHVKEVDVALVRAKYLMRHMLSEQPIADENVEQFDEDDWALAQVLLNQQREASARHERKRAHYDRLLSPMRLDQDGLEECDAQRAKNEFEAWVESFLDNEENDSVYGSDPESERNEEISEPELDFA